MYMGNPNLRHAYEMVEYTPEQVQELVKCSTDIAYFAQHYCYIITLDEGKRLIELYDFQIELLKILSGEKKMKGKSRNAIVRSARQTGKSTIMTIYVVWYILFNKSKKAIMMANKAKIAYEMMDRIRLIYEELPYWMQVGVVDGGWNRGSIRLSNGSEVSASATSPSAIRGMAVSLLILDEFAFLQPKLASEFVKSVFPVISSAKKVDSAQIVIVSTPNGLNHYYKMYSDAKKPVGTTGSNDFIPFDVKWYDVPGRDESFKNKMIGQLGQIGWMQEYACVGFDTTITVKDVDENIFDIKIGDLFDSYDYEDVLPEKDSYEEETYSPTLQLL
jgi:hypothetical protein